jgi:hypothetical protein
MSRAGTNSASARAEKACVVCGNAIPIRAIYCKTCDHYQSVTRRALAGLDITALIALVSSTTLAATFIDTNFLTAQNDLAASAISCDENLFRIAFENAGKNSAVLQKIAAVQYVQPPDPERRQTEKELGLKEGDSGLMLRPGEQRIIDFQPKDGRFSVAVLPNPQKFCYFVDFSTRIIGKDSSKQGIAKCECS